MKEKIKHNFKVIMEEIKRLNSNIVLEKSIEEILEDKTLHELGLYNKELIFHYLKTLKNLHIIKNEELLLNKFPFLMKLIKRRNNYLIDFLFYSQDKIISRLSRHKGNYYFFVSARYLSSKYGGSFNTWLRNINIFCTLGLINKVPLEDVNRMARRRAIREKRLKFKEWKVKEDVKEITFYSVPLYSDELLERANEIAKKLIDNNFRANGFNKIFLIKVFGHKFANKVFNDDRTVTGYSDYVSQEIEKFIMDKIENKGYTTKEQIINEIDINLAEVSKSEYGFIKGDKRVIVEREFARNITNICKRNNLRYKKANKVLVERFKLDGFKTIVYENN